MKKILFSLIILNSLLILGLLALVLVAETYPFAPESSLYQFQLAAEQWRLGMTSGAESHANWAFKLSERRLADLAKIHVPELVDAAVTEYVAALDQAAGAISILPTENQVDLFNQLQTQLNQAETVALSLESEEQHALLSGMSAFKANLQSAQAPAVSHSLANAWISAKPVPFLDEDVDHEDWPLTGAHADLECETCHQHGLYTNTPTECAACHKVETAAEPFDMAIISVMLPDNFNAANPYPEHFPGTCDTCHTADNWIPFAFDHEGVTECQSCHYEDLPAAGSPLAVRDFLASYITGYVHYDGSVSPYDQTHYPGECSRCHTDVTDWTMASFNHSNIMDCESCHLAETPQPHYDRACTRCHEDVEDWNVATFDHTGYTDCLSCHEADEPFRHYNGQCSACHTATAWEPAFFDHTGYADCKSCHTTSNHYSGQCSSCHNETDWFEPFFNHNKFSDCADCHDAPTAHYPGECSTCHSDKSWKDVSFSHISYPDCTTCHTTSEPEDHYNTTCANCHNTVNWEQAVFNHVGLDDCATCHAAPTAHYNIPCAECHTPISWYLIQFDHTGYTDCASCHLTPANHYPGLCVDCHNSQDWYRTTFVHTESTTKCTSCHTSPTGHWPGECANCHETDDWTNVHFDHTNYTNCKSCHIRPANHSRGQCSNCHNTENWGILLPTPTPTATQPPDEEGSVINYWPSETIPLPTPAPTYSPLPTPAPYFP
jgi:hypothetical protein